MTQRVVVFVHGLWMSGHESILMRRELKHRLEADALIFSYQSVAHDVTANAGELAVFLNAIDADELHLVGHSLGGLVILACLQQLASNPPPRPLAQGRVVLLGSPLQGCSVARSLSRFPILKAILGRGIEQEALSPPIRRWNGPREVGIIAGNVSIGLGRLVASLDDPNDGTVRVEETQLEGAVDHIVLPVSHTGMVFSTAVMEQTVAFLQNGRFNHEVGLTH